MAYGAYGLDIQKTIRTWLHSLGSSLDKSQEQVSLLVPLVIPDGGRLCHQKVSFFSLGDCLFGVSQGPEGRAPRHVGVEGRPRNSLQLKVQFQMSNQTCNSHPSACVLYVSSSAFEWHISLWHC